MVKRALSSKGRFKKKKKVDYVAMANNIMKAITSRTYSSYYSTVQMTSQVHSGYPRQLKVINEIFTPSNIGTILADVGKASEALGTIAAGDRFTMYKMKTTATCRNLQVNPVYVECWVLTPKPRYNSHKKTPNTDLDTYSEVLMADNYDGWNDVGASADIANELVTYNVTASWNSYTVGSGLTLHTRNDVFPFGKQKLFRERHETLKHYRVLLQPGQSFSFNYYSKKVKDCYANLSDDAGYALPGTTVALVSRIYGDMGATADSAADPPAATLGQTVCEVGWKIEHHASVFKQNIQTRLRAINVSNPPVSAATFGTAMFGVTDSSRAV